MSPSAVPVVRRRRRRASFAHAAARGRSHDARAMKNKKKRQERARADEDALAELRARPASALGDVASDSEDETVNDAHAKRRRASVVPGTGYVPEGKAKSVDASLVNKNEKTLVLTSRGATSRYRHLMLDLLTLVPNAKKDAKLDTKNERNVVVEAADLRGCSSAMFFECRKKQDCYVWLAKTPSGPSIKFHVENVHTMAELKMTGNHLKFSRPSLHFAPAFDETAHRRLIKEALIQTFATPYRHFKSKPFYDHQMCFYWEDNRVWFRNYQVVHPAGKEVKTQGLTLSETGPRLCLHPIKIFAGAFGGAVLFEDETFVSPNAQRAESKKRDVTKYQQKVQKKQARKAHKHMNQLRGGELDDLFRDGDD